MLVNGDTWEWVWDQFSIVTIDQHWLLPLPLTLTLGVFIAYSITSDERMFWGPLTLSISDWFGPSTLPLTSYLINWGFNPFFGMRCLVWRNLSNVIRVTLLVTSHHYADDQCKRTLRIHSYGVTKTTLSLLTQSLSQWMGSEPIPCDIQLFSYHLND